MNLLTAIVELCHRWRRRRWHIAFYRLSKWKGVPPHGIAVHHDDFLMIPINSLCLVPSGPQVRVIAVVVNQHGNPIQDARPINFAATAKLSFVADAHGEGGTVAGLEPSTSELLTASISGFSAALRVTVAAAVPSG